MSDTLTDGVASSAHISGDDRTFILQYLFGNLFSIMLGMIVACKCTLYVLANASDRALFKAVVGATAFLTILHICCTVADTVYTFGLGFGDLHRQYSGLNRMAVLTY